MIHLRRPLVSDLISYLELGDGSVNKWFESSIDLPYLYKFFSSLSDLYAYSDTTGSVDGTNILEIQKIYIITTADYYLSSKIFSDNTNLLEDVKFFIIPSLSNLTNNKCQGEFIYNVFVDYNVSYDIYRMLSEDISNIINLHYIQQDRRPFILSNDWPKLNITNQRLYLYFTDLGYKQDKDAILNRIHLTYNVKYAKFINCDCG